ncbi:unnamed protein product [Cyprideis torosa]|uniref:Uncharacterized protein n=1 Tax=Cyprideis torosa TaxID=163714 RepID=A0A7R8W6I7_9CRUS|nr:unnamed protein product [Cyprideis torosa]CAG0884130.1 unnamed protein product [Cyprideis torosa]
MDRCKTQFGKRLLRRWLSAPLTNPVAINARLDALAQLMEKASDLVEIAKMLRTLPDLERALAKMHSLGLKGSSDDPNSRAIFYEDTIYSKKKVLDFIALLDGFKTADEIASLGKEVLSVSPGGLLHVILSPVEQGGKFPALGKLLHFFSGAFDREQAKREGRIVPAPGVDAEYDGAQADEAAVDQDATDYLREQARVFGCKVVFVGTAKNRYQLEVPETAARRASDDYHFTSQRKGFRRFVTTETKALLSRKEAAEERRAEALRDIARRIFKHFDQHVEGFRGVSRDAGCPSVHGGVQCGLRRMQTPDTLALDGTEDPDLLSCQPFLEIVNGRHPCLWSSSSHFIPNSTSLGGEARGLLLLTGANMGGKSTLMRQTGLLLILAQLGCYVPAESMRLTPADRVFCRLGASDALMKGESTFYVELSETSAILKHATPYSLVLIDELGGWVEGTDRGEGLSEILSASVDCPFCCPPIFVGRGTATFDGTAIASAVASELAEKGPLTIFSSHYHTLTEEFQNHPRMQLGHMACMVEDENEDPTQETITFLYQLEPGACPKSYGFNVARLAGLPDDLIRLGNSKAKEFERKSKAASCARLLLRADVMEEIGSLCVPSLPPCDNHTMPCSAITLSLGTIAGVVSVALLGIAFGTDNWMYIRVDRNKLKRLSEEANEIPRSDPEMKLDPLFYTRTKGLFRTCFPKMNASTAAEVHGQSAKRCCWNLATLGVALGWMRLEKEKKESQAAVLSDWKAKLMFSVTALGRRDKVSKDIYRSPVESYCVNIDYFIPDEGSEFTRFSEEKKATIHMGRSMIALFIVSFLFVFIAFWSGIVGCWRRSSGNVTATAILMLFVCLLSAGAMGLWHGVDYYEQKKLEEDGYPPSWPAALKESTYMRPDWSYFLAWIGVGFALFSSIFFFSAALNLRNERDRELGQKMQYLYPIYPQKQQYAYSYAYPGPYYPSSQYGQYNY